MSLKQPGKGRAVDPSKLSRDLWKQAETLYGETPASVLSEAAQRIQDRLAPREVKKPPSFGIIPDEVGKPDDQPTLDFAQNEQALAALRSGKYYPGDSQRWYSRTLVGVAFMAAGMPDIQEEPDPFSKGRFREVVVWAIRLFDEDGHRSRYSIEARLTGGYIVSRVRGWGQTVEQAVNNPRIVFTIEEDPETPIWEIDPRTKEPLEGGQRSLNLFFWTGPGRAPETGGTF